MKAHDSSRLLQNFCTPAELTASMAALVISQHTIMSAAMLNAKRARMKVEADRQLLANRIARLQAEEMKSVKRIEETHRRTQEILLLKTRQQQGELEKEAVKHEEEARLTAHREHLVKQKEERKYAVLAARQAAAIARQNQAKVNKQLSAQHMLAVARVRSNEFSAAVGKRNAVRESEAAARERKLREKQLMLSHLQSRAEERQGAEVEATAGLEGELHEMEQEELRLLQSLQEYQAKQQQTYRELEQTFAAQREELGEMRRQGSRSHQSSSVSVAGRSAAGLV